MSVTVSRMIEEVPDFASIIRKYNDVTERLKRSHEALAREVGRLSEELRHKNKELERRDIPTIFRDEGEPYFRWERWPRGWPMRFGTRWAVSGYTPLCLSETWRIDPSNSISSSASKPGCAISRTSSETCCCLRGGRSLGLGRRGWERLLIRR